jgi:phosphoglycolate phosphatase
MQKVFELIVFDWDGTLMDSEAHIINSMQCAFDDVGMDSVTDASVRNIIGLGMREAVATLLPEISSDIYDSIIDRYRYHFFADDSCEPFDGVGEVLESLYDQGYLLAVATGKGRQGMDRALASTGFGKYFLESRCADETRSKPDPQMLNEIIEILDVSHNKTLMVGDTEYDLEMANAAGIASLGVDYGAHERDRLLECNPLDCLASIQELPEWLLRYPKDYFQ